MKQNLHNINKASKYIGGALLVLLFAFTTIGARPQNDTAQKSVSQVAISNYLTAQQSPDLGDEEKIKAAIDTYFTIRYEGQKLVKPQDFSALVEDNSLDWVKKEKDKREIELYIASLFDLGYQSYTFTLDYDSIEIKNNKATVQLRESHDVVFDAIAPEASSLYDLPHALTLHRKKGSWLIYKDEYTDELSGQIGRMTKDEIKNQVNENFKNRQNRDGHSAKALTMPAPAALVKYTYNRTAAVNYANAHTNNTDGDTSLYNTAWYKTEDFDCANFVSQALYAGEGKTPPDTSGMTTLGTRSWSTDWYYVFNNPKGTQNGSGSKPWINVQSQYDFIGGNTGKIGPYGWIGSNYLCYVKIGDIVQLYGVNYPYNLWDHEGIIVSAPGPCTSLSNYTVDAHTRNRKNYPLSYWSSYPMRYILIAGWFGN